MFQEVEHLKKTIEEAKPDDISQEASSKLSFTLEYSVERGAFDIVVEQRLWYYHCTVKSRCCNNIASKLCCYKVCLLHAWNINTLIVAKYFHVKLHSQPPTHAVFCCLLDSKGGEGHGIFPHMSMVQSKKIFRIAFHEFQPSTHSTCLYDSCPPTC